MGEFIRKQKRCGKRHQGDGQNKGFPMPLQAWRGRQHREEWYPCPSGAESLPDAWLRAFMDTDLQPHGAAFTLYTNRKNWVSPPECEMMHLNWEAEILVWHYPICPFLYYFVCLLGHTRKLSSPMSEHFPCFCLVVLLLWFQVCKGFNKFKVDVCMWWQIGCICITCCKHIQSLTPLWKTILSPVCSWKSRWIWLWICEFISECAHSLSHWVGSISRPLTCCLGYHHFHSVVWTLIVKPLALCALLKALGQLEVICGLTQALGFERRV